jgi:enoyl-CoA hydratase/3-hydroxyacyl-CoA dehydrogenase
VFVFKAAVVGAGTMGGEIAQVIAAAGIPVLLKDVDQRFVEEGLARARAVAGDPTTLELITPTTTYEDFGDVDLVVEAVPERLEVKQAVFAELDAVTPGHAILASNTSSLSISEMALATSRPEKVVGFHFFYPASMMRLVEVVEGAETSPETMQAAAVFAQGLRKLAIVCAEVPGFVVNRILNSAAGEVWRVQEERGLSIEAVDDAIAEAEVAPTGPFVLSDLLGLDTVLHVARHLNAAYGDSFYVHEGMAALVEAGELGAKTGRGFYENGAPRTEGATDVDAGELAERFALKALVEACLLLEEGVATTREIDLGMMAGAGMVPPPFARADAAGLDRALARLEQAEAQWGERYAPPAILRRLVAQGRLGDASGQGFFPVARPDASSQGEAVKLELRGATAIAWLDRPRGDPCAGDRLGQPDALLCRRRHQGLHQDGPDGRPRPAGRSPRGAAGHGARLNHHHRRRQRWRLRRRLRAGHGLRRAHRRSLGHLRPARDRPGHHARLRRHAAPAAPGRRGQGAGDEPHRRSDQRSRCPGPRVGQPRRARP